MYGSVKGFSIKEFSIIGKARTWAGCQLINGCGLFGGLKKD